MDDPKPPPATVFLRPMGSPVALGLAGLTGASLVATGMELGWVAAPERHKAALILLAFPFPLQLAASLLAFAARDGAAGTALGLLSGTWLATALVWLSSPPGAVSGALGLLLLVSATLLATTGVATLRNKMLLGLVFVVEGIRFACAAIHELGAAAGWQDAAGVIGIAVVVLAGYGVAALVLEESSNRTILPLGRREGAADAITAPFADQLAPVANEAGVRQQL